MIRPEVKIEMVEMEDPTFEPGVTKTASAVLTNPTTKEFTYAVELYLDIIRVTSSGVVNVTIGAGQSRAVNFTLTMPTVEGTYPVYLDVKVGTQLIAHYRATEDIVIQVTPQIVVGPITWV